MLTWKTIRIDNRNFIGMYIALPKSKLYIITSTTCILAGDVFDVHKLSPRCNVFIMSKSGSFKDLLESNVKAMNNVAKRNGFYIGMSGREALLYSYKKTTYSTKEI